MTNLYDFHFVLNVGKTWLIDFDGTIVKHNGHLGSGDELLPGVKEFWERIPKGDVVVIMTARSKTFRSISISFLRSHGLRFDYYLDDLPKGERVLLNDAKPDGTKTAFSVNLVRDRGIGMINIQSF